MAIHSLHLKTSHGDHFALPDLDQAGAAAAGAHVAKWLERLQLSDGEYLDEDVREAVMRQLELSGTRAVAWNLAGQEVVVTEDGVVVWLAPGGSGVMALDGLLDCLRSAAFSVGAKSLVIYGCPWVGVPRLLDGRRVYCVRAARMVGGEAWGRGTALRAA